MPGDRYNQLPVTEGGRVGMRHECRKAIAQAIAHAFNHAGGEAGLATREALDAIDDIISKKDDWILVSERLPPFDKSVLVYCVITGRYLAWYEEIGDSGHGQWCSWDGEKGLLPPTHWMPLPDAPSEA